MRKGEGTFVDDTPDPQLNMLTRGTPEACVLNHAAQNADQKVSETGSWK